MASTELLKRLANGGSLVVAEGYLFELERRGYLQVGSFVPEVILKHPEVAKSLHEEFVHAGSDVVVALTYYGHREKMRLIGQEDKVEMLNRKALCIARDVAKSTGTILAGNICNSSVYQRDDEESKRQVKAMFKEQIEWAVDEGAQLILAETFLELGEAMLALECIKEFGKELLKRLANGGSLVVAEGYIFELERRGYLQVGSFVPEVILKHPEVAKSLHEEFVHAGSEVVVAITYYGHREKMRVVGQEDKVEALNRKALCIARDVAKSTGTLLAGNICNSCVYQRDDEDSKQQAKAMFKEQIEWAVDEGVQLILAETFNELGEAMLALECIKEFGKGVPAVVNLVPTTRDVTTDGVSFPEACRQLEEAGAAVVGLNCARGPKTMIPLIREVRKACKGPVACLPVPYRTSEDVPTMQSIKDPVTGDRVFPIDLPAHTCARSEIKEFAEACKEIGVQFVGLCCGNCSHYTRIVAEVYGKTPPASEYSPDMSKHYTYGDPSKFKKYYTEELTRWQTENA